MRPGGAELDRIREQVDRALRLFLAGQRPVLADAGDDLLAGLDAVAGLLADGKRLRPAFCYWGWRGAGGQECPEILAAAAALELLHAGALVHDDVIDASNTRRGRPSLHKQFEARHQAHGWRGSAAWFGMGAALLLGDLLMCWTDDLFHASGLPADVLARGRPVLGLMRTEVCAGQYLDLAGQASGAGTVASALRAVELKTAKYTVERPLHLGAALAGHPAGQPVAAAYSAYGLPLGIAFQLRDDLLGVFGDPARTGKPAGDDLREGKQTVLLALACERASTAGATVLDRQVGNPCLDEAGLAAVRAVIQDSGAVQECERLITARVDEALKALTEAPITEQAKNALAELAVAVTVRDD
ncbi:MAG TPA: polyprenyl synthetase family protein [Streptosporangiaceae bacterium]|nr:polyprenyl synthetase family protein [Streptosporangiaceae bacterium]